LTDALLWFDVSHEIRRRCVPVPPTGFLIPAYSIWTLVIISRGQIERGQPWRVQPQPARAAPLHRVCV